MRDDEAMRRWRANRFGLFIHWGLYAVAGASGSRTFRASNGLMPNDGQWHHVAVTYRAAQEPHFTLYVDGQGKQPTVKFTPSESIPGRPKGGDFTLQPDAPDSVLRIGCRADGDTWRYVRSHLRGLLDELQIYDEALKAEDIRFLPTTTLGTAGRSGSMPHCARTSLRLVFGRSSQR